MLYGKHESHKLPLKKLIDWETTRQEKLLQPQKQKSAQKSKNIIFHLMGIPYRTFLLENSWAKKVEHILEIRN